MKRGFTLAELLVSLAIFALLMLVAIPSIIGVVNRNKERQYELVIEEMIVSATEYVNENRNMFTTITCDPACNIQLVDLITDGKWDADTVNPKTSEVFDRNSIIKVTIVDGELMFNYEG